MPRAPLAVALTTVLVGSALVPAGPARAAPGFRTGLTEVKAYYRGGVG